jgi:epoxide hydrolase-like predicted phosphatase
VNEGDFDAVLFDFGGVFMDSPFAHAEDAAGRLGIPFDQLSAIVFGSYDRDDDHPWHRLERGEVPLAVAREAIVELSRQAGLPDLDPIDVLATMGSSGEPRQFMTELVHDIRAAGIKTGLVTNNVAEFAAFWRNVVPLDELFDDVIDSSAVGIRKPNEAIFALACQRLEVDPARTLFIDDYEGNASGARRAGLVAVCCGYTAETTRSAVTDVRRLLTLP